jgi:hypothetical protein
MYSFVVTNFVYFSGEKKYNQSVILEKNEKETKQYLVKTRKIKLCLASSHEYLT